MLQVIADYDNSSYPNVKTKPRLGIVRRPFFDDLDPEIENAMNEAFKQFRNLSSDVLEIDLPSTPGAVQAPEVYAIHAKHFRESPELYGRWMRARLEQAAAIDTVTYIEARQELDRVRRFVGDVFSKVDLLVTPTTRVPPITIKQATEMSPEPAGELWLWNTRPFNAYGFPTISIPCGFTKTGLPIGLQISSPNLEEGRLLSFAYAFEQTTLAQKRTPPVL
jgi:aspartyl-tRNA(Asn)/glutamyl-tRNA(Gln) amidotransferase subunit A